VARALVVSDLHLGSRAGSDVLRSDRALEAFLDALDGVDRLILLGDTLEFRQGPVHEVLERAAPVLRAIGERLGERPVVLLPGNHDHALASDWLAARNEPLGLEQRCPAAEASFAAASCARLLAPAPVELAYPGLWLRPDVYATHGHYLDVHMTMPTLERLAVAGSGRLALAGRRRWDDATSPDDYEAVLTPVYAWAHAAAQTGRPSDTVGGGRTAKAWSALSPGSRRIVRARLLGTAFPLAVRALNRAGLGPLRSDVSTVELRRAGLRAISEVVQRLDIPAAHVIFGHTHRAGMLADDVDVEWLTPSGVRLHNAGAWVHSEMFARGPESPYWPGGAVVVEDAPDGGQAAPPPRLVRLLAGLGGDELSVPRAAVSQRQPAPA
jgi:hypothetical protein